MSLSQFLYVLSKPSEAWRGLCLLIVGPEHELTQANAALHILQLLQCQLVYQQPCWLFYTREASHKPAGSAQRYQLA